MNKFVPQYIRESQLKVAHVETLETQRHIIEERLLNARTTRLGARSIKLFLGGVSVADLSFAAYSHEPIYGIAAGLTLSMAAISHGVEKHFEQTDLVYDFNLSSIESEIQKRIS